MSFLRPLLCVVSVSMAAGLASPVHAAVRSEVILASENCQPALPAFDGSIRKRPLAMQNEGTATAFITCSFVGVPNASPSHTEVSIVFINTDSQDRAVACTLVDGRSGFTDPAYFPQQVSVAAGTRNALFWRSNTLETNYVYPALSCALPPGVGIEYTYHQYDDAIVYTLP